LTIHIDFTQRESWVEQNAALGACGQKANLDSRSLSIAADEDRSIGHL
jgi:hypothetical protein